MISRREWMALSLASSLPAWAQAGGRRVALVIGNAAYTTGPLLNPTRDAAAMSGLLRGMGFQVVEARDANRPQMQAAIQQTRDLLKGQDGVGLLYYAGHGLQLDWRNYMLPVDVNLSAASDVPVQGVDVQAVLDAFKTAGNRMNILVLDACRDNPFPQAGSGKGLAPLDAPPGTFFAYATAPGNVAEDGSAADGNGLYTKYLLQEMQQPQARIEDVFKRVRLQVRRASQGRQVPWESTSLEDDFSFATGQRAAAPSLSAISNEFDAEKADWDRIKDSVRADDFYAFLQRHPNGRLSEAAYFRLNQLARSPVLPQQALRVLPPGADRYWVGDTWAMRRQDHLYRGKAQDTTHAVTAIEGQRVLVDGGESIYDQMGGVLLSPQGAKDPALQQAPSDLQVGKRWRSAYSNTRPDGRVTRSFLSHRCVGLEDVELPAGRFKAFRIEAQGESVVQDWTRLQDIVLWVDPETMLVLQQTFKLKDTRTPRVLEHSSYALLWRKLVPRR